MAQKSYEDCFKILNLTTLGTRHIRGDLVQAIQVLKGFADVTAVIFSHLEAPNAPEDILLYYLSHNVIWTLENMVLDTRQLICGLIYLWIS